MSGQDIGGYAAIKPDDYGVKKDSDWYKGYAQYVAGKYNPIIPRFYPDNNNELDRPERWASRVMRNYAYLFSQQENSKFDFMALDENNTPLPTKLINTHVIFTLVTHMEGNMQENISSLPETIFARALDSDYIKYKKNIFNLAKMKMEFAQIFADMQGSVDFMPTGNKEFDTEEELRKHLEEDVQSAMEKYFTAWAKDWLYKTDYMSWVKLLFRYIVPAYFGRVELYTEKGQIKIKIHKPSYCIWDNNDDDEFGRKQRFQGVLQEYTIPQLKSTYPELTGEQITSLQTQATGQTSEQYQSFPTMGSSVSNSVVWFGLTNNLPVVTVVKARWVSIGEDDMPTWYQTDLIGNLYAVRSKPCDNLIKNMQGYLNPPFIDFIPEIIYGVNRSPVDRSFDLADKIKGYEAKLDLIINRIKGNIVTLFADKFPEGMNAMSIAQDIANGVVTLEGVNIDDMSPMDKRNFMFKVENIGVDYNSYNALRSEIELAKNEIRDIFSIPRVAMGTQQAVVGKGVQEQSIQQATYGVLPLYDGFNQFINNVIHAACETRKGLILASDGSEEELETLMVTKREYDIFKISKDWALTDLNIYLDRKDAITEKDRGYLMSLFDRELQIPDSFVDSAVAAEALTKQTNTELRNFLNYKKKVHEAKLALQAQQAQEQQMALANVQANSMENMTDKQSKTKLAETSMKIEGDLEKEALKADINSGAQQ